MKILQFSTSVKSITDSFAGLFFPSYCMNCLRRITSENEPLCRNCMDAIVRAEKQAVEMRLQNMEIENPFDKAVSFWLFDRNTVVQEVHQKLKYGNCPWFGPRLGKHIGKSILDQIGLDSADVIVPVPLHRTREMERGYNQSTELARGVRMVLNLPILTGVIVRDKPTRSQTKLNKRERWQNVQNAFKVINPGSLQDKRVLLIDDLLTTGATAASAANELKRNGATKVILATLGLAEG